MGISAISNSVSRRSRPAKWLGIATTAMLFLLAWTSVVVPALADSGDRTLYLYYTHTRETQKFTFRKGGRYDTKVLADLNYFLRDWRRNEPTKMDPALFDLVWEVYQEAGATGPIYIVSAYRAPETNEMLRSKSSAVAKNSRHTMGMAMDFFIPGIPISKLREIAMRKQVGGVGYYPTSGSPFVHLDTGNVRAWPRMTHAQLQRVFPDGKTLHIPADGKVLSQSGYQYAKAQWMKCHTVPCSGSGLSTIRVAAASGPSSSDTGSKTTLFDWLFGNEPADAGEESVSTPDNTAPIQVASIAQPPVPVPADLPTDLREIAAYPEVTAPLSVAQLQAAPLPATRPAWLNSDPIMVASVAPDGAPPRPVAIPPAVATMAAYAPIIAAEPDAQRALQILLERRSGAPVPPPANLNTQDLRLASLSSAANRGILSSLISDTLTMLESSPSPLSAALAGSTQLKARQIEMIAPDLEHIVEIFVDPAAMTSSRYAVIFEHDTTDFSPESQMGSYTRQVTRLSDPAFGLNYARFSFASTLVVASR